MSFDHIFKWDMQHSKMLPHAQIKSLISIQKVLFDLGAQLASGPVNKEKNKSRLPQIKNSTIEFLETEIDDMNRQKEDLFSDDDKLERYAREHYYFKKDNEDVYVIEKED